MKYLKVKDNCGTWVIPEDQLSWFQDTGGFISSKEHKPKLIDFVQLLEGELENANYHNLCAIVEELAIIITEESSNAAATRILKRICESNLFMR